MQKEMPADVAFSCCSIMVVESWCGSPQVLQTNLTSAEVVCIKGETGVNRVATSAIYSRYVTREGAVDVRGTAQDRGESGRQTNRSRWMSNDSQRGAPTALPGLRRALPDTSQGIEMLVQLCGKIDVHGEISCARGTSKASMSVVMLRE